MDIIGGGRDLNVLRWPIAGKLAGLAIAFYIYYEAVLKAPSSHIGAYLPEI